MDNYLQRLEDFFAQYTHQEYKKGHTIIYGGEEPAGVFYIKQGRVREYTISADTGATLTLHIYHQKSYFPLTWAVAGKPNHYFFETLEPTILYRAPREAVVDYLKREPKALFHLTTRLLMGLDGMLIRVEMLAQTDVYGRVISELLYLVKHYGNYDGKGGVTIGRFTHQEISEFVGSARETVSIVMKKLEDQQLIQHNGHDIFIPDIERLIDALNKHHSR